MTLTFDLLTLKMVSESGVTWATCVPILTPHRLAIAMRARLASTYVAYVLNVYVCCINKCIDILYHSLCVLLFVIFCMSFTVHDAFCHRDY